MSLMVVVIPAPVLSRALAGAGIPGRAAFPGIGSGAGSLKGKAGDRDIELPGAVSWVTDGELVKASVVLLVAARRIPNELAIALRDEATDAVSRSVGGVDSRVLQGLTFRPVRPKLPCAAFGTQRVHG